ncbi:MAG: hypothetical protein ACLRRH_04985 [Clostridium sp.]
MESSSQNNKGLKWIKRIAIILILAGVIYALYPKIEGIINSAKKIADIANERNIYNTIVRNLILDELEEQRKHLYRFIR